MEFHRGEFNSKKFIFSCFCPWPLWMNLCLLFKETFPEPLKTLLYLHLVASHQAINRRSLQRCYEIVEVEISIVEYQKLTLRLSCFISGCSRINTAILCVTGVVVAVFVLDAGNKMWQTSVEHLIMFLKKPTILHLLTS